MRPIHDSLVIDVVQCDGTDTRSKNDICHIRKDPVYPAAEFRIAGRVRPEPAARRKRAH